MKVIKCFHLLFVSFFVTCLFPVGLDIAFAALPSRDINEEFEEILNMGSSNEKNREDKGIAFYKTHFLKNSINFDLDLAVKNVTKHLIISNHFLTFEELNGTDNLPRVIHVPLRPKCLLPHAMSDLRIFLGNLYETGRAVKNIKEYIDKTKQRAEAEARGAAARAGAEQKPTVDLNKVIDFVNNLSKMQVESVSQIPVINVSEQRNFLIRKLKQCFLRQAKNSIKEKFNALKAFILIKEELIKEKSHRDWELEDYIQLIKLQEDLYSETERVAAPIIKHCYEPCVRALMEELSKLPKEQFFVSEGKKSLSSGVFSLQFDFVFFKQQQSQQLPTFVSFMRKVMHNRHIVSAPIICDNSFFWGKTTIAKDAVIRMIISQSKTEQHGATASVVFKYFIPSIFVTDVSRQIREILNPTKNASASASASASAAAAAGTAADDSRTDEQSQPPPSAGAAPGGGTAEESAPTGNRSTQKQQQVDNSGKQKPD